MDRKTLEQNYQSSIAKPAELEQNYQKSSMGSLVQSVKNATQYNPSAPSTQPKQAAPAGASSGVRKQSDTMKEQVDALKKQRDDAALKLSAYMRAGNMQKQAEEQFEIANRAGIDYANAYTNWKNQRNMEAVEDYNPEDNHFKAVDAVHSGLQNAFQSTGQAAVAASSYLSGSGVQATKAWKAKALMDKGVKGTDAVKQAGLMDKREIPITDYKTKAELRHEKNLESVGAVEGGALQLINTISNMVPSIAANDFIHGAGLPLMAASAAGNKYSDAYEKYGNTDMAFVLGSAAGGASMFTESFGGIFGKAGNTAIGKAASKKLMEEAPGLFLLANSKGGKLLRDAFSEGLEEGAEDHINYAIEKMLTGDSDEMDNVLYDMLLGALAGGVLGGVGTVVRTKAYNRLGKALNASPDAVSQLVEKGTEKGPGTAPYIYAQEVQKNPSNQMVGKLYDATVAYNADQGLSKLSTDVAQVTVEELKDMISLADRLAEAAKKLGVEANPEAVTAAVINKQTNAAVQAAENAVGEAYAPTVETPTNAGEAAYNSALAGGVANQGIATRINNDPAAKQSFAALTGANFTGEAAHDIAEIQVATKRLAQSGKQAVSQSDYDAMVANAGEQARARVTAEQQAQVDQLNAESEARRQSLLHNTIVDENGKRHVKEITDTDVRGDTEIGYKKAEITKSKKKSVDAVNNAAKYLGKTIVWFDGALQINGQYRLANGFRAPDGTIYVNINSADPLMVTFGHEMFHDLVSDGKYGGMIDTLVESPEYAATIKVELEHKEELYRANGIELTADEAAEEVAADICGSILGSKSMLEYIGARNAETATGIKGWLDRILNKLKRKPTAQEAYERLSESQRALIDGMEWRTEAEFYDPTIGEDVKYSIREEAPPEKTLVGYKVFVVKDGKLYPPMVANPNAEDTPVGVWLNADIGARAPDSKTGRMQVKAGGKGTQGGSGSLAFRPGWHLGEVPVASQFDRLNPETGKKELFPSNFVWAECLIAADIDYQEEAMSYGYTKSGKFQHSLAGLPKLPVDGYYKYRTNPRPDTVPWLITGAMKVNRILSDSDVAEILTEHGITPPQRQGGAKTLEQLGLSQYDGAQGKLSLMGRGNGYDGRSMSNNARKAYENGEKPLSKWSKSEILEAIESINPNVDCSSLNADTLKQYFLNQSSWHHTSAMYNETRFYSVDEAYIADLTQNDVDYLADHQVKTAKSAARDKSNDSAIDDTYAKARAIVNAGIVKTESGAINKLLAGKSFDESYEKAADIIKARDASRVNAWRKLPEGHWRKEYVNLYDNDINAYIKKTYAPEKLSRNSKAFKALEGYFKQSADQTGAKNAQEKLSLMETPTTDSTGRELSAEQKEYFKDSKVRDEDGNLLVVYHGTDADFTVFDASKGRANMDIQGMFFSPWELDAQGYGSNVSAYYLDIKNPASEAVGYKALNRFKGQNNAGVKAREYLQSLGYDGVNNGNEEYIAFEPSQIKRIDNLTPTGSKDIRYSLMRTKSGENFVMVGNPMTKSQLNDPKAIADYIASHIGEMYTIIENGQKVYIGEDLPNEYTRSKYSQSIIQSGKKIAKNKAISNLGEMVEIATNRRWEKAKHSQNKDAAYGMYRYDTTFAFPVKGATDTYRAYDAEIVIRNASDGKKYLYDIVGIKENTGLVLDLNQKARGRQYAAAQSSASNDSLPQSTPAVNTHSTQNANIGSQKEGDHSLMDTLPQEKYFADLDQAVAEATAKSEEALKAAQNEVTTLRQQLLDYRNHADAEAKMNERWRDAEAKLVADLAAAREREKASQRNAAYMRKYDALSKQYRADSRASNQQTRQQYEAKLSDLRDGYRGQMEQLAIETGAFKRGENAARDINVPTSVDGKKVTRGTRTILEASQTPETMLEEHAKEILGGARGYEVISDQKAQDYASRIINDEGFEKADELFTNAVRGDRVLDKNTLVLGEYLYMEAAKAGDVKNAMRYAADVAAAATRAGQVVQAMRVLKKATPTGKLYYLNRMVDTMNKDIVENGGTPIQIDENLARNLLETESIKDADERNKAADGVIDEIEQNIADQIPASLWDKWNAWRYLSMLGNIRTQVRNVVGNTAFMPLVASKNLMAAALEKAFIRNGGDRTKTAFLTKTKAGKQLMEYGKQDFETVVDEIQGGGKYNQASSIEEKKTIFKNKALEGWRKLTNKAMDKGDEIFSKHHYARALAGYLYANHLSYEKITRDTEQSREILNKARAYAIREAQKATFRDANQFASAINRLKRNLTKRAQNAETKASKAGWYTATAVAEGIMPFTKTPIDILVRGVEYSPIGLIKGIKEAALDVKSGKKTAAEAIDTLSAGLTGTGIFVLGYFLHSLGFLVGPLGDDKKDKYLKDRGVQGLALHIGNKYYTIDWLAPFSLPLFTGAAISDVVESGDQVSLATLADVLTTISEPMLEMSMLQGLNSALSNGQYSSDSKLVSFVTNQAASYISQANPTILGQIARAADETSRNAYYYDPNYKGFVQSGKVFFDKQLAKIPGASTTLTARIDLWGNKEKNTGSGFFGRLAYNMLSPGYYSTDSDDPVDVALTKLYESTEDTKVLPSKPQKTVTNDKKDYKMTAKQYEEYCIVKGQTAHKEILSFVNSAQYKSLTDEEKVDVIESLYKYSTYKAQKNLLGDKHVAAATYGRCVKAEAYAAKGNPVYKFFLE